MSYSPYGNTGINTFMPFNNYGYQPPVQAMPPEMPPVQQIQKTTNCEFIYVNGIQQVKEHIVQPGCIRYFLDNNEPVMYEKKADNLGSCIIKAYSLSEIDTNNQSGYTQQSNTVTRDEFNILTAKIQQLEMRMKEDENNESFNTKSYPELNQCCEEQQSSGTCAKHYEY
ncbi:hypothetical protein [Ruminococcus flavefaciens]|uniref:hypothetical protein n=1 Tax=Ruminococcus flavefaciens TaxID=1265 RepID=UPI0026E98CD6|nr:hypothetical protein [Ruminococcus flavefaciens]